MLPKELKSQIDILDEKLDICLKFLDMARQHALLLSNMIKNGGYSIDSQLYVYRELEIKTRYIESTLETIDVTSRLRRVLIQNYIKYERV